jgi:hypothetical protein
MHSHAEGGRDGAARPRGIAHRCRLSPRGTPAARGRERMGGGVAPPVAGLLAAAGRRGALLYVEADTALDQAVA